MRRCVICVFLLPCLLAAAERWIRFTSGPYEVLTDAGARPGREALVRFEQFRHAVGSIVGEQNLDTALPIRIFVFRNPQGWTTAAPVIDGRDRYAIVLPSNALMPTPVIRELTRLFLESNTARMPAAFERGLIDFFSTIDVSGIRITAGKPPASPNIDWARIHLLVTDPEYFGKLRVLLYNLRRGVAEDAAYRNAFGKGPNEIAQHVTRHFAAGNFQPTTLSSRPMSERDFPERAVSEADIQLARADLLAGSASAADYEALVREKVKLAEAHEGLGILALRAGRKEDARRHFEAATAANSTSARAYIEYAKLEPDTAKADTALRRAATINPKLDEPFALLAKIDTDPRRRILHLTEAAQRNPRNAAYWKALAEAHLSQNNFGEAAKAWRSGEQAASDPAERERMHKARMAIEQQRLDYEDEERKRAAAEKERDLERLKEEARAEVRRLEGKFNQGAPKPDDKPVPWWDGPAPSGRARGILRQVDCLGKQARVVIETDAKMPLKLLAPDPERIMIIGGGEKMLACGPQQPRRIAVEYFPKKDTKLGTSGEVAVIEFQ